MPIREDSFLKIKKFQEEHVNVNPMRFNQMTGHTGNMQMYGNYATGFYQNEPVLIFKAITSLSLE